MTTYSHGYGDGYFSDEQLAQLLKAINSLRVGKDGKGFAHVEAYEIRAHLNRILGYGRWDEEVVEQHLVFEEQVVTSKGKDAWNVCYRSIVRLAVRAPNGMLLACYTEGAAGDCTNIPSRADAHDLALKTSQSQAFKRCAMNLGDQFGLSLYNKGSLRPIVGRTLVGMASADQEAPAEVDAHITTPLAPEREPETPQRETSSAPATPGPSPSARPADVSVVASPAAVPDTHAFEDRQAAVAEAQLRADPTSAEVATSTPATSPATSERAATSPTADTSPTPPTSESETVTSDAVAAVEGAFPGAEVVPDPFDWCLQEIHRARRTNPATALTMLKAVQETAVRSGLRTRKLPDSQQTLGAHLVELIARCTAAAESQAS